MFFTPFAFYFLFFAALSAFMPFAALYFQTLGLSGGEIGLLMGIGPLISMVAMPVWTGIADATRRYRLVLSVTISGAVISMLLLSQMGGFWPLLAVIIAFSFISAPIVALADSATMSMLGERKALYGRLRVGGTIGWGIVATVAGVVIERFGLPWMFWLYAMLMAAALLVGQGFVFGQVETRPAFWSGVRSFLADRRWMMFLGMVFFGGVGMATINTYQFVYMQDIGMSKTLMGISLTLSTLSELPIMFFADYLVRKLKPSGLLVLGMAAIGARLLLYAAFNFPVGLLLAQVIHGLTFPLIWIAGVSFSHEHAPAGLDATAQGLFGSVMMNFGGAAGSFLGGLVYQSAGGRGMYLTFGLLVLCGLGLFSLLDRFANADSPT